MTEPVNKKSKDGRYRFESTVADLEPVIEPLTGLDVDDPIERLLIDTGFDAEDEIQGQQPSSSYADDFDLGTEFEPDFVNDRDYSLPLDFTAADDDVEPVDFASSSALDITDPEPPFDAVPRPAHEPEFAEPVFADPTLPHLVDRPVEPIDPFEDAFLSTAGADALIEPVELDSPVSDDTDEAGFSHFNGHADAFIASLESAFPSAAPAETPIEPVDLKKGFQESDPIDLDAFFRNRHPAEPRVNGAASPESDKHPCGLEPEKIPESDIHDQEDRPLDPPPAITPRHRPLGETVASQPNEDPGLRFTRPSAPPAAEDFIPEEVRRQIAALETKAQHAERLAYAALCLSLLALCASAGVGYQYARTHDEMAKVEAMQSVIKEDVSGLNEKLEEDSPAAQSSAVTAPLQQENHSTVPEAMPAPAETRSAGLEEPAALQEEPLPAAAAKEPAPLAHGPALEAGKQALGRSPHPLKKPVLIHSGKRNSPESRPQWAVNLASFRQVQDARRQADAFRKQGIEVEVTPVDVGRTTWYRLSIRGFASRDEARSQSSMLKKRLGLNSVWVAAL